MVQHTSPQQFRAVPLAEATATLRDQYEAHVERLENALERTDAADLTDGDPVQEVWSMSGTNAIANCANQLITDATTEIVLVLGVDSLRDVGADVDLLVGAVTDSLEAQIREAVPAATTFVSGLDWLRGGDESAETVGIGRLMLVDRSTILVSTIVPDTHEERAVFGDGFQNGLVVISRRLLAQGLLPQRDPDSN